MVEESQQDGTIRFSSTLEIIVLSRPAGQKGGDWQEVDRGPGYFHVDSGQEIGVKIKSINDYSLTTLVDELRGVEELRYLDLSENRNVTNEGVARLTALRQLTVLNLSSCSVTNTGILMLKQMPHLERLLLSFCNKLSDEALKAFETMRTLEYVDIQGCLGISQAGLARIRRRNLTIYR